MLFRSEQENEDDINQKNMKMISLALAVMAGGGGGYGVVRKCRMDGKPDRQFHLLEQFIDGAIYYLQPDRQFHILLI
jgi:hypothetical protein